MSHRPPSRRELMDRWLTSTRGEEWLRWAIQHASPETFEGLATIGDAELAAELAEVERATRPLAAGETADERAVLQPARARRVQRIAMMRRLIQEEARRRGAGGQPRK